MAAWDWLLGSVDEHAEREFKDGNYKPGKTRKRDWGDRFGEWATGRKSATDEAVKDLYIKDLQDKFGVELKQWQTLPGYDGVTTIDGNTREQDLENLRKQYGPQYTRRSNALDEGAVTGLTTEEMQGKTTRQILQMANDKIKDDNQTETERLEGVAEQRVQDERTENARIRAADRLENAELRLFESQMRNADRALEREMEMFKIDKESGSRKAELWKALFGLGSAFMI